LGGKKGKIKKEREGEREEMRRGGMREKEEKVE